MKIVVGVVGAAVVAAAIVAAVVVMAAAAEVVDATTGKSYSSLSNRSLPWAGF